MINNLNLLALNIHFQIFIKNKSISFTKHRIQKTIIIIRWINIIMAWYRFLLVSLLVLDQLVWYICDMQTNNEMINMTIYNAIISNN